MKSTLILTTFIDRYNIMTLRLTYGMKLFALLIFSSELLTPLLFFGEDSGEKNLKGDYFTHNTRSQNQLYCLLAEELGANEESGEGHKEFTASFNLDLFLVLAFQFEAENSSIEIVRHTFEAHTAKPRLFILNCLLLI